MQPLQDNAFRVPALERKQRKVRQLELVFIQRNDELMGRNLFALEEHGVDR
jgi:hypothetical protein